MIANMLMTRDLRLGVAWFSILGKVQPQQAWAACIACMGWYHEITGVCETDLNNRKANADLCQKGSLGIQKQPRVKAHCHDAFKLASCIVHASNTPVHILL